MSKPDVQAGAPRKPVGEERAEPLASELRAPLTHEEIRALIADSALSFARGRSRIAAQRRKDAKDRHGCRA